ncbi:hypothetical protein [Candidatus Magnetaquiglobus chichijimensis]|uniref:hypothetical protein n=1 Tax=Candidatus Magnetaquiglobus chichijimensis TaxID=3141448 RepID=UPI003B971204
MPVLILINNEHNPILDFRQVEFANFTTARMKKKGVPIMICHQIIDMLTGWREGSTGICAAFVGFLR